MNMQRLAEKIEREYVGTTATVTECGTAVEVWDGEQSILCDASGYLGRFTRFNQVGEAFAARLDVWSATACIED